ncbi:hypothetical protein BSZ39_04230 [Bowdeniella nasicola]|uniref:Putative glucose-6-phosphate 1-epimerase n=1 Tax=Bowdeniella nasicola TaxID=208480 RepID=A0A1Q5Q410_9ACTO|nr:hypothetical protein [Bowdeniella nasicola]OKL54439.1 hypothetical protein BSZ39_04230 [Bowdeniella nasicola]
MALHVFDLDASAGRVSDLGAQVLSWTPHSTNRPVLFTSRRAGQAREVHAGIPICAPWFGQGRTDVSVPYGHGLVRWIEWDLVEEDVSENRARYVWELDHSATEGTPGSDDYPADLYYRYVAEFDSELRVALTITSPTQQTIVDQAFHTYFYVDDLARSRIDGLDGSEFLDGSRRGVHDGTLQIEGPHDVIYFDAIADSPTLTIGEPDRTVTIRTSGARDAIVWNPGPDGAQRLNGFDADEWEHMMCVEVGNVQHHAVTIPAGGSHTLSMSVAVEE